MSLATRTVIIISYEFSFFGSEFLFNASNVFSKRIFSLCKPALFFKGFFRLLFHLLANMLFVFFKGLLLELEVLFGAFKTVLLSFSVIFIFCLSTLTLENIF